MRVSAGSARRQQTGAARHAADEALSGCDVAPPFMRFPLKALNRILSVLSVLILLAFGVLSLTVLGFSLVTVIRFRQYEQNDLFDVLRDNVPVLLLSMLAVFAAIFQILKTAERGKKRFSGAESAQELPASADGAAGTCGIRRKFRHQEPPFPWPMLFFVTLLSLWIVFTVRGKATNDALQLDGIMQEFARGDYSSLKPGGYLYVYPFQITYVWIGVGLQALFGPSNYPVYQILNVISIGINLYLLYQLTWELFENRTVCLVMQFLACGSVFYDVYATFVYADLWSFALQTAALWLQVLYWKRGRVRYEAGAGVCIAAGCLLKSNCYVALIAMVILLIAEGIRGKTAVSLRNGAAMAVLICAMTLGASAAVKQITAKAAGLDAFPQGVPALNYVAMGMQETEGKYGWYNGTNVAIYRDAGWDRETSAAEAEASIRESVGEFRNSGRYTLRFYLGKFLSQWGDPTCVSMRELEETGRHVEEAGPAASSLIFGMGYRILSWVMNVFHSVIWLGTAVFTGGMLRKGRKRRFSDAQGESASFRRREGGLWLLVLFVFGGMLFHELWEASGRYTMRYYLTLLPLSSWGGAKAAERLQRRIRKRT